MYDAENNKWEPDSVLYSTADGQGYSCSQSHISSAFISHLCFLIK